MRIAGVNIPDNKRLEYALTAIYGIGRSLASKILNSANIDSGRRPKDLSNDEINKLREIIEKQYIIEGNLKRIIAQNIKRLKDIKSYRGIRHIKKLPVRGQRTKTNSRTRRGNVRITMGSGRRKVEKK
jgi:small subunit ribosomal protein S13